MQIVDQATGSRRRRAPPTGRRRRKVTVDYVAGEFAKDALPDTFTVGDAKTYGRYLNRPLQTNINYDIYLGSISTTSLAVEYHFLF